MPRIDELTNEQLLEKDHGFTRDELSLELDRTVEVFKQQPWNRHWQEELQEEGRRYWLDRETILNDLLDES